MIYPDFILPFVSIFLAELGDKTQLALLVLAAKTSKPWSLAWGAILAFAIVDGLAVLMGTWISDMVPPVVIQMISAGLFLFFGLMMLKNEEKEGETKLEPLRQPWLSAFLLILITEWGDKTQIASAVFAARYEPVSVFAGVIGGLALLSVLTAHAGKWISTKVDSRVTSKAAAILFILMGIFFTTAAFFSGKTST